MKLTAFISSVAIATVATNPTLARGPTDRVALPEAIASAVDSLDSPRWVLRDQAESELHGVDPIWADTFRRIARSGVTVETALRLKRSAEELFVTKQIGPSRAFLGISHIPVDWQIDARIPPGSAAMRIGHTIANTAAEKARMQVGDLIIAVDGLTPTNMEEATALSQLIGGHKPGENCEFTILRKVEGLHLNRGTVDGFDPRGFRDVVSRLVTSDDDERLPAGAVGLRVISAPRADTRAGVVAGDVIIGLDGRPIPARDAQDELARWCEAKSSIEIGVIQRPNRGPRQLLKPNLQIIRGGRRINISVPLGRVPLDVASRDQQRLGSLRGATPERIRELRRDFERWWSMQDSSVEGPDLRRIDPSLFWQMNP